MNILLAYLSGQPDRTDSYISLLPVGLCSLQANLRSVYKNVLLANYSGWSNSKIESHIKLFEPTVVGISIWTHNRIASIALACQIRHLAPNAIIIAGGAHATFQYEHLLQGDESPFDAVVLGEGEQTILELLASIKSGVAPWHDIAGIAYRFDGNIIKTQMRDYVQNLDSLPFASAYLDESIGVDTFFQAEFMLTSRGCPSACTFCSSPAFWSRKVRFRSPESIVAELLFIREHYGLIYFSFRDDTFTVDRERTIRFCKLLIENKLYILWNCQSRVNVLDMELISWMKRAGCECIQLGVESGSPRILRELGKNITPQQVQHAASLIRAAGINLSIYLISDVPGETEEDLQHTFRLIRAIQPDDGYVSPLAYFPGTSLFEQSIRSGLVLSDLFEKTADEALFVTVKSNNSQRIIKALARNNYKNSIKRLRENKKNEPYCYAANVLAGEWFRQNGYYQEAKAEFQEISIIEPDNPWGWFLMGELCNEIGDLKDVQKMYKAVCLLVPKHKFSLEALNVF